MKPNFMIAQTAYNLISFNAGFRDFVWKSRVLLIESAVHLMATKRRTLLKLVNLKFRKHRCACF